MMDATIRSVFDGLGDARVRFLSWQDVDFVVEFDLAGPSAPPLRLRFKFVTRLRIDLDFGELMGAPLLFVAEANKVESGGWSVRLSPEGAPVGVIEFGCDEIVDDSTPPREQT